MLTRRLPTPLGEASFDHGAQYFTARDQAFAVCVAAWAAAGHFGRWSTQVEALERGETWRLIGSSLNESGFDAVGIAEAN